MGLAEAWWRPPDPPFSVQVSEVSVHCLCDEMLGGQTGSARACLAELWVFENLAPAEIEALLRAAWRKQYAGGEPIFFQGDQAEVMFLIKAGRVKLSKYTEGEVEVTLDIRKAGDFLGETMLSEDLEYPVSAWCLEDTVVCGFTKTRFEALVLENPNIGLQVIRNLSNRILVLTSRMGSLSAASLEDRLYGVLSQVANEHGTMTLKGAVIQFPLTHEDLSFLVGAHRVSITRAMKALRESGRVVSEGRTLIVRSTGARS